MGQKVNPTGMRLGIVKGHTSVWYADKKQYSKYLLNDLRVREFLRDAAVAGIRQSHRDRASGADRANFNSHRAARYRHWQER